MLDFDAHFLEHFKAVGFIVVVLFADNPLDSAVDYEHGAGATGSHLAVNGGSVNGDSPLCGLTDCVLLGMYCAHAMLADRAV